MEGDHERACRHLAEFIGQARPGSDGVMASWKSMLARDLYYLGRVDELDPLLEAARASRHSVERTFVAAVEALLLSGAGAHDRAEERARAAVATAETETDNVWLQGWSNEDLALVLERAGRVDEARESPEAGVGGLGTQALPAVCGARSRADRVARANASLISLRRHCRTLAQSAATSLDPSQRRMSAQLSVDPVNGLVATLNEEAVLKNDGSEEEVGLCTRPFRTTATFEDATSDRVAHCWPAPI